MENNTNVSTTAKTEIKIDPRPFPGDMKTDITTSIRLAETISSFFSGIFKDYSGCQIRVNDGHGYPSSLQYIPAGAVYANLYFSTKTGYNTGEVACLKSNNIENKPYTETEDMNIPKNERKVDPTSSFLAMQSYYRNTNAFTVTKDAMDILSRFTFEYRNDSTPIVWRDHFFEENSNISPYEQATEVVLDVNGLDVTKIIAAIYGVTNGERRFDYAVTPSSIIPNKAGEFIVQISQLDTKAVRDLQNTLGVYSYSGANYHKYYGGRQ